MERTSDVLPICYGDAFSTILRANALVFDDETEEAIGASVMQHSHRCTAMP
jgi:hypothetical protein